MSSLAWQSMDRERRRIREKTKASALSFRDKAQIFDLLSRDQIRRAKQYLKRALGARTNNKMESV